MTPKFVCVKSFMDTDAFRKFSTKYGLDSEIVASFCESFATHIDLPKEKWFKYHPPTEVKVVEPSIAIVKDLLADNIDGYVIYFCDETARIAKPCAKDKHRPVVGMPVIYIKIGDHCYHGLCDVGASVSAIPFLLYIKKL